MPDSTEGQILLATIIRNQTEQGKILADQNKTLGELSAGMRSLIGNGSPGRIDKNEDDIDALKASKNYLWGFGAGILVVEGAFHFVMHKMGLK